MARHGLNYDTHADFTDINKKTPLNDAEKTWAKFHSNICFKKTNVGRRRVQPTTKPGSGLATAKKTSVTVKKKNWDPTCRTKAKTKTKTQIKIATQS